jgi:hypothetical protein
MKLSVIECLTFTKKKKASILRGRPKSFLFEGLIDSKDGKFTRASAIIEKKRVFLTFSLFNDFKAEVKDITMVEKSLPSFLLTDSEVYLIRYLLENETKKIKRASES